MAHYYCALIALGCALLLSLWVTRRRRLARRFKWAAVFILLSATYISMTWWVAYRNREYHRWLTQWLDFRIKMDIYMIEYEKKNQHDLLNYPPILEKDRLLADYHRRLASRPWYRLLAPPKHPVVRIWDEVFDRSSL